MPAATATRAKARNNSTPAHFEGMPFDIQIVSFDKLIVDVYQRPLTNFVDRIKRNFDPSLVGTLTLSDRGNGQYAIIDGQTRVEGMRGVGLDRWAALVYQGLTLRQEANMFAKFVTERRSMHSAQRFNSEVIAGREPQVTINRIVTEAGYIVSQNVSATNADGDPGRGVQAPAALEYVYRGAHGGKKKGGDAPELLEQTLRVIKATWPPPHPFATGADMVKGLGYFLNTEPNVDEDRLISRLRRVQPSELARRAEQLREGRGMSGASPAYIAEAITSEYRRRGR